jgi:tetratricopeptide (TPR) repeat protein
MSFEAVALLQWEDPSAAEVATSALQRCRELDPVPVLAGVRILTVLAGVHLSKHEWERAVANYEEAIRVAGPIRELAGLGKLYDGLSLAYQGLGDLGTAVVYSQKALTLSSVVASQLSMARVENNLGVLLLRQDRLDEAEIHLRLALANCQQSGLAQGVSHVLLSLAQLAFRRHRYDEACDLASEAIELSIDAGEALTEAVGYQWQGRILAATGRHRESDRMFQKALSLLGKLDVPRRLAECHRDYAMVLKDRDDLRRSVEHWQQAADLLQRPVDSSSLLDWMEATDTAN